MTDTLDGGCLCGAVRYRVTQAPLDAGYCHCRLCQRAGGAPVLAWLTVPASAFAYTHGTPTAYASSTHSQREFCARCGTPLAFQRIAAPRTIDVTIASLDDPARVPPQYHIWTASRIGWFDTADALPRHADAGPDVHDD